MKSRSSTSLSPSGTGGSSPPGATWKSKADDDSAPSELADWAGRSRMSRGRAPSSSSFSTKECGASSVYPMESAAKSGFRSNRNGVVTEAGSFSSEPWISLNTSAQSSIVRHMGPVLSMLQESTIPP